ncbi:FAD-dependent oxidoreductase domain-containing protein 2, partial [Cichlidogyrus casuarinus]
MKSLHKDGIPRAIGNRLASTSGLYQMFKFLGDVYLFNAESKTALYFEELPVALHNRLDEATCWRETHWAKEQSNKSEIMTAFVTLEYGDGFSGPGTDTLREDRAYTGHNFLHP